MSKPKWWKEEWQFWIPYENGKREFNIFCKHCSRECKQSFRVEIINCPHYDGGSLKNIPTKARYRRKSENRGLKKPKVR